MRHMLMVLVQCAALAIAVPAEAQLVMRSDARKVSARAEYAGLTQHSVLLPAVPYSYWSPSASAHLDNPDPEGSGYCDAGAWQISQVVGYGISASGGCGGSWQTVPLAPHYVAESAATFDFELQQTMTYSLDAWLDPGEGEFGGWCWLAHYAPNQIVEQCPLGGELHRVGRLAPGLYEIDGWSIVDGTVEWSTGPTYTYILTFSPIVNPLIVRQPVDTIAAPGATVHFSVATSVPTASLTFQWRRNGALLANGAHVSGATTPTLSLSGIAVADTGWYEVIVANGSVEEPSRLARLNVSATSSVPSATVASGLALELAGPNPSTSGTALRYAVAQPQRITVAIYDVTGARVRTLLDGEVAAKGLVSWDGRNAAGGRVPNGLYFARLSSPAGEVHRTLALMH